MLVHPYVDTLVDMGLESHHDQTIHSQFDPFLPFNIEYKEYNLLGLFI